MDTKNMPKEMPPVTGEFDIDVEGQITRKKYVGTFSCRILNRKLRALVEKHKAFLNGPGYESLSLDVLQLHHRISYLRFSLEGPYPKFWGESDLGYELYDQNIIDEVFLKVLEFETKWMIGVWGKEAVAEMKKGS